MVPWLHVVIPAYGPSPYLDVTITSLQSAAVGGVRFTVLDDGSPGTEVADIVARHDFCEYVRLPDNRGVAGAFNEAVAMSTGEYTLIMGSDDLVRPQFLAELQALVERFREPTMVTTQVDVIGSDGSQVLPLADRVKRWLAPHASSPVLLEGDALVASLLTGNWLYFPAIAWRTSDLVKHPFRADMHTAMDLEVELRLLFDGARLCWSPRPLFLYRRHAASVSSVTAAKGSRFVEEAELFRWAALEAGRLGWRRSELAGRVHATSRLHSILVRARRLTARGRAQAANSDRAS